MCKWQSLNLKKTYRTLWREIGSKSNFKTSEQKDSHFSLFLGVFGVCCGSFSPQEDVKLALKWFPDQQDDSIGINESVDFLKRPVYYYPNWVTEFFCAFCFVFSLTSQTAHSFSMLCPKNGAARIFHSIEIANAIYPYEIFPTTLCRDQESNSRQNRVPPFSKGT